MGGSCMNWIKNLFQALIASMPELFKVLRRKKYSVSTLEKNTENKKKAVHYVKNRLNRGNKP